jgi:hypothetical protein
MSENEIDKFLKILPKLIKENDTVKGAIISALSGVVATHEDIIELNKQMDKRFEAMQKQMDERFEAMQKQMDKRFMAVDRRFDIVDGRFDDVVSILKNIQKEIGKPFEQFCRNIVIRILEGEGLGDVKLESRKIKDPEMIVSKNNTIIEIDGLSLNPPVIMEVTTILKDEEKIDKFLRKKEFIEKKYGKDFRGFFIAATTVFTPEEIGEFTVKLRKNNSEFLNL